ncbi:stress responsive alpha/beta barrel protein [Thermosporothrix hazakensis]|uniref:Stress responsive alpha/beta barrel protein n=1 Tax=Thermosporothrix hazakensis TaxID=644383 RepID=A0A326UAD5_THEHA|nr:Dabb family protein [Thermosporothrix hazakensis]PZW31900.1 stress responsive alpha/beta barrel protein [Thermosporothrix hazakensis]GCE49775.1 hypothetical protein KTH_46440 [Thermosporothrix hazakensis]
MIIHLALYRFFPEVSEEQRTACIRELEASTERTGLVAWFTGGRHLALPADEPVQQFIYDYAALWGFTDQQALEAFSIHPAMKQWVATFVRPFVEKLAIANFKEGLSQSKEEGAWACLLRGNEY